MFTLDSDDYVRGLCWYQQYHNKMGVRGQNELWIFQEWVSEPLSKDDM